jgi:outer membrane protein OmpA-like peptidoglycan-associated protein
MQTFATKSSDTQAQSCRHQGSRTPPLRRELVTTFSPVRELALQRKPHCACGGGCPGCGKETEEAEDLPVQPKLAISTPGDPLEQEADYVAEQVMRMPQEGPADPDSPESSGLRFSRYPAGTSAPRSPEAPPAVYDVVQSPGEPLDPPTRALMEPRFGRDFSQVRVHTDAEAAESARSVDALAFTVGRDVVFGAGLYAPTTSVGQRLLAHELAHVLQQSGGGLPRQTIQRQAEATADPSQNASRADLYSPGGRIASIYFPTEESELDDQDREVLKQVFAMVQIKLLGTKVTLTFNGFADRRGKTGFNLALSRRRAESVAAYFSVLERSSVNYTPMIVPLGESEIPQTGSTEGQLSPYRRVDIVVDPPFPQPKPESVQQPAPTATPQVPTEALQGGESAPSAWWAALPHCPCMNPGKSALADGWCSEGASSYHPGAAECFREVKASKGPGQQCCYGDNGCLITTGPGAGTPDKVGGAEGENADGSCNWNSGWAAEHWTSDVWPFDKDKVDEYHKGWPPDKGVDCHCPGAPVEEKP